MKFILAKPTRVSSSCCEEALDPTISFFPPPELAPCAQRGMPRFLSLPTDAGISMRHMKYDVFIKTYIPSVISNPPRDIAKSERYKNDSRREERQMHRKIPTQDTNRERAADSWSCSRSLHQRIRCQDEHLRFL